MHTREDIEGGLGDGARVERPGKRGIVDDAPPGHIDHARPALYLSKGGVAEDVLRQAKYLVNKIFLFVPTFSLAASPKMFCAARGGSDKAHQGQ